jgi:phage tail-like protein
MATSNNDFMLTAFNFKVEFTEISDLSEQLFQEVSGLSWEVELEDLPVGGANDYNVRLPRRIRYPNLMLKRAMLPNSALVQWMDNAIQSYFISPANPLSIVAAAQGSGGVTTDVIITLMNGNNESLLKWQVFQAFPLKWNLSPFNAMENKYVVESLEFGYQSFKRL